MINGDLPLYDELARLIHDVAHLDGLKEHERKEYEEEGKERRLAYQKKADEHTLKLITMHNRIRDIADILREKNDKEANNVPE